MHQKSMKEMIISWMGYKADWIMTDGKNAAG
jgi:hypothetical protein